MWDEPTAAVRIHAGAHFDLHITWEDPVGVEVSTHVMKIESSWYVAFHKPKLDRPIRPGLWGVSLRRGSKVIFRAEFLVVPLTHENKVVMASPQAINAQRGNVGAASPVFERWKRNVTKSGAELERWVDELVGGYWEVREFCGAGAVGVAGGGDCSWVPDCTSAEVSSWSTLSPDPKSEIGEVQNNGRLR